MNHSNSFISSSEFAGVRRLLSRLALFSIPFLLAAGFILVVDPFSYFRVSSAVPDEVKLPIVKQLNSCFWKLSDYEKKPKENILLGDSRMEGMDPAMIKEVSGEDYANLAYGGGSLREAFDTFWLVSKQTKLKKVYIGVALGTYNDYEITNRTQFYRSVKGNPAMYFINRTVWESSIYAVYSQLSGKDLKLGVPQMSKDAFWQTELGILQKYYDRYVPPKQYRKELKEISNYCQENGIIVSFVIFPMHADAQKQIVDSGLQKESEQMRSELAAFGKVYDFERDNELSRSMNLFDDPVHLNTEARKMIIGEIWSGNMKNDVVLTK